MINNKTLSALSLAHGRALEAQMAYENEVRALLPPGTPISWLRGAHVQQGYVHSHAYRDSFFARNAVTGKLVKLHVSDVLRGGDACA